MGRSGNRGGGKAAVRRMPDERLLYQLQGTEWEALERRAIEIVLRDHAKLGRDGKPHWEHVFAVADGVEGEERLDALLHDLIEDTDWTAERLRAEGFSENVVDTVVAVSRRMNPDGTPAETYHGEFIPRIIESGPRAVRTKRRDAKHNLKRCREAGDHSLARRYERSLKQLDAAPSDGSTSLQDERPEAPATP